MTTWELAWCPSKRWRLENFAHLGTYPHSYVCHWLHVGLLYCCKLLSTFRLYDRISVSRVPLILLINLQCCKLFIPASTLQIAGVVVTAATVTGYTGLRWVDYKAKTSRHGWRMRKFIRWTHFIRSNCCIQPIYNSCSFVVIRFCVQIFLLLFSSMKITCCCLDLFL